MIFTPCVRDRCWSFKYRLLLIMKLAIFLTIAFALHAVAESKAQKITLHVKNAPLREVMQELQKQQGYSFLFHGKHIADIRVDAELKQVEFADAMNMILNEQGLNWSLDEGIITIVPMPSRSGDQTTEHLQQRTLDGRVTDIDGNPLEGVTVTLKGTSSAVTTDANGDYRIPISQSGGTLIFTIVGFEAAERAIGNRLKLDVAMTTSISDLEEVVVVGYGTQKRGDLTGSIASADLEALSGTPNLNIFQSVQGTVPGLNIGMVDEAGETPSISIRGRTSLSGNQNPLIILDGIIFYGNLASINPNDIKTLDILKDASSKAIYGAQAANGVILITTKSGRGEQKPQITYTGSYAIGGPSNRLHTRNRESYLQMIQDIFWKDAYTEESGYLQLDENFNILETNPFSRVLAVKGYETGADIDWWDLGTTNASIQQHNVGIQGASARTNYYLSLAYDKQQNYIINDKLNRKAARINIETQLADWLNVGVQTFGTFADLSGASPNLSQLTQAGPLRMPYDETGKLITEFGGLNNPLIAVNTDDLDQRNELFGNLYAKIKVPFLPGFTWDINYGNTLQWLRQFNSNPYASVETGEAQKYNYELYSYTFDNILNYTKELGEGHHIDATLVLGKSHREAESTTARATSLANQTLGYNDLSQGINQFTTSGSWEETSLYQMFRVNYAAFSKYYFTATLRRDGFSGFAENEKTAYFPSVGIGWTISEEAFLRPVTWLNHLKLRFSYGVNGNLVQRYSSLASVGSSPSYVFGDGGSTAYGHAPSSLPNTDLRWEKTYGSNLGLDFDIFDDRIVGNLEYYQTTTRDLIWSRDLPILTGFNSIISNIGQIGNRGFEASITATAVRGTDFQWKITGNFSLNRNRIEKLLGDIDGDGEEDDLMTSNLFIGEPIGAVFGYDIDGIYQFGDEVPTGYYVGSYRIVDRTGDGVLSAADRVILGMTDPLYRFGIHNHFQYKGFSLKVFLNSIQGGKTGYLGENEPFAARSADAISDMGIWEEVDFWTPRNPGGQFRSPASTSSINPMLYGRRSFLRLQDVILSYRFDTELLSKLKLSGLSVTLAGKNLFTLTDWNGWDPETGSGLGYGSRPVMRHYSIGLALTF
ncbi:TonB-linked outer membrane protein, SusC/RagA family [Parapedobacter indicus]|uniref:TonB-linked outer membrane protein, SusC/RagA family n=2 Tax=Parapedobacter indicus TaxID=1477437 RepID=A0A1I3IBC8_9SPHI|nr:TonB-linked SusC/RagA family outer membrane protein [Parapedobacter indicus]SFI45199.1 TonB-linked outer membrane protein, SusC/RagA family [Parapedobacter indicus]